jgi:hypothetical protein
VGIAALPANLAALEREVRAVGAVGFWLDSLTFWVPEARTEDGAAVEAARLLSAFAQRLKIAVGVTYHASEQTGKAQGPTSWFSQLTGRVTVTTPAGYRGKRAEPSETRDRVLVFEGRFKGAGPADVPYTMTDAGELALLTPVPPAARQVIDRAARPTPQRPQPAQAGVADDGPGPEPEHRAEVAVAHSPILVPPPFDRHAETRARVLAALAARGGVAGTAQAQALADDLGCSLKTIRNRMSESKAEGTVTNPAPGEWRPVPPAAPAP